MIGGKKIVAVFSIAVGMLLFLISFCSIGFYIYTALQVWGKPDTSLLFWYSFLLIFGIIFFLAGVYFIFIGLQVFRGNAGFYKINKYSLILFFAVLALLIGYSTLTGNRLKKQEEVRVQLESKRADIEKSMHTIKSADLQNDVNGINLSVLTTDGAAGEYDLHITITYNRKVYLDTNKRITLSTQEEQLNTKISYPDLFKKCFEDQSYASEYICVNNTGTSNSMFDVVATFSYSGFKEQSQLDDNILLQDTKELSFTANTMNKNGKVEVSNFQVVY